MKRAADVVYVTLARRVDALLVTLDTQMRRHGKAYVSVMRPQMEQRGLFLNPES